MIEIDIFVKFNVGTDGLRFLALNSDNKMCQGEVKESAGGALPHITEVKSASVMSDARGRGVWTQVLRVTDGAWAYPEIGNGLFTAVIRGFARVIGRPGAASAETGSGWDDMEWRIENNLRRMGLNPHSIALKPDAPSGIYVPQRLDVSLHELVVRADAAVPAPTPPLRATVSAGDSTWNF